MSRHACPVSTRRKVEGGEDREEKGLNCGRSGGWGVLQGVEPQSETRLLSSKHAPGKKGR